MFTFVQSHRMSSENEPQYQYILKMREPCQCTASTVLNEPLRPRMLVMEKGGGIWEISEASS